MWALPHPRRVDKEGIRGIDGQDDIRIFRTPSCWGGCCRAVGWSSLAWTGWLAVPSTAYFVGGPVHVRLSEEGMPVWMLCMLHSWRTGCRTREDTHFFLAPMLVVSLTALSFPSFFLLLFRWDAPRLFKGRVAYSTML